MSKPKENNLTWEQIRNFTYGKCANCNSRNWKVEKIGYYKSNVRKVPKTYRKCLSCNKYNGEKWWSGLIMSLIILIPPVPILVKFFPGQIKYPTYISEEVFFIFIPIYLMYIFLVMIIFYNFFSINKIIDSPKG